MDYLELKDLNVFEKEKFISLCEIISCLMNNCSDNKYTKCVVAKIIRETSLLATECRMLNGPNKNNAALISPAALLIKQQGKESKELTLEHGVPIRIITEEVLKLTHPSAMGIASIIYSMTALAVITNEEDKLISKLGLRSKMPDDWNGDKWIRYKLAGIDLIDNPYKK